MQPDPWLTFWLAVGGAAAALASGFGSIWALTQKRRYLPKPLMLGGTSREETGTRISPDTGLYLMEYERLRFTATNKGDGAAHDVRMILRGLPGERRPMASPPRLDPSSAVFVDVALSEEATVTDVYGGEIAISSQGADPAGFWAELTWRQAPNMKRVRRLVIREKR